MNSVLNVSAYRFVAIDDPLSLRSVLAGRAGRLGLLGTILIAGEGINLFLAGAPEAVTAFLDGLRADPRVAGLQAKESWSARQPFRKLLVNALKYTPDGGRVIVDGERVRRREATAGIAGYVDVRFRDTGIGVDPGDAATIFEKFATIHDVSLHSSSKSRFKGGGPGLGLPIARGIIEAHGGRVWVESAGRDEQRFPGSTFHVELPLRTRPPAD